MEGLEVSLVRKTALEFSGRVDSEYYQKKFLKLENQVVATNPTPMGNIGEFLIGPFGSAFTVDNYTDVQDYRYIRGKDVKPLTLLDNDNVYMPAEDYMRLEKYALRANDVMISVVGTIGNAALVTEKDLPAVFSCKSSVVRPKKLNPVFLTVYLNCRHGRNLTLRKERGAIQKGLNLDDLKDVPVFEPSQGFQRSIEKLFRAALDLTARSKQLQMKAEKNLLAALELVDWTPPEPLSYTARASKAFAAGRLDAEHFRPKYAAAIAHMTAAGAKTAVLESLIEPLRNGVDLRDFTETGTPYIRVGDIKDGRVEVSTAKKVAYSPKSVKKSIHLKAGDILFTRKGSFGNAAVVGHDQTEVILSTEIILLRLNESGRKAILPDYLAAFFNGLLGKLQAEQWAHGVAFYSVTQDDLYKFEIPLLDRSTQQSISVERDDADRLRLQSLKTLEAAKRAVEIAIEDGEPAALTYLDQIGEAN